MTLHEVNLLLFVPVAAFYWYVISLSDVRKRLQYCFAAAILIFGLFST